MLAPEDQPTLLEILTEFGISNMLDPGELVELLDTLAERELVLRTDAVNTALQKEADK